MKDFEKTLKSILRYILKNKSLVILLITTIVILCVYKNSHSNEGFFSKRVKKKMKVSKTKLMKKGKKINKKLKNVRDALNNVFSN